MEDNIESMKEIRNNKDEALKNSSMIDNSEKNQSVVNNLDSIENEVDAKEKNTTNEINSENNNKNVIASTKNDFVKDNNKELIADKEPKTVTQDINKTKVSAGSESSNVENLKPKKEIPIEKKPFNEFVNDHLLPSLINEFKERGFVVEEINLKKTSRPIAGDKCWVIYCEIKDICNFWLSFEKEDISSLKSISLCKSNQNPSVIESFLIDEKRITLNLIISRILQRLNGQKLIGIN